MVPYGTATESAAAALAAEPARARATCQRRLDLDRLQRLLDGRDGTGRAALVEECDEIAAIGAIHLRSLQLLEAYGRSLVAIAGRSSTGETAGLPSARGELGEALAGVLLTGWTERTLEEAIGEAQQPALRLLHALRSWGKAVAMQLQDYRALLREVDESLLARHERRLDPVEAITVAAHFAALEREADDWQTSLERFDAVIGALIAAQEGLGQAAGSGSDGGAASLGEVTTRVDEVRAWLRSLAPAAEEVRLAR
ncbi:hypothetical protein AKJ08_2841 [Vulgatibacter incomptus]|uniref:Uncharacterized protein n=1 Tax=Vulgatibacter incomptus TaxID=1391653 RepID=A0A0K1PH55_9BACT|nr:hypothetical protein AKJ08_2841 [Vulgatibacter incomptus]